MQERDRLVPASVKGDLQEHPQSLLNFQRRFAPQFDAQYRRKMIPRSRQDQSIRRRAAPRDAWQADAISSCNWSSVDGRKAQRKKTASIQMLREEPLIFRYLNGLRRRLVGMRRTTGNNALFCIARILTNVDFWRRPSYPHIMCGQARERSWALQSSKRIFLHGSIVSHGVAFIRLSWRRLESRGFWMDLKSRSPAVSLELWRKARSCISQMPT